MSLFDECIQALGENFKIFSEVETEEIFAKFENTFPISAWGRIKWEKIQQKIEVKSVSEIIPDLNQYFSAEKLDKIYILWDNGSLPAIEAPLIQVLNVIDDVTAVSFDTWLFSPILEYVVEFYHEGDITIGIKKVPQ
ncbi:hypothetical protein [Gloeothece verrucosa]|uniref:Uncharacterized protein n=1 Tax=Gloeothece verrucosa (strain PCC 7822) TaxID=497965 RepID=E0ULD4_GLOV7|nr:hypothetical protein [Gloeothece verrucosa]ADN17764.1 conserved hypothetical protein [Gloeothece verrucosa PCC 7822]